MMVLALLGALAGLVTLQRLADVEAFALSTFASPLQRLAQVGKLVAIGLPLMLAAFWLFPRFSSPLWGVPERALSRPGLSDSMSPGGWLDLMADDSPALRAQFFGATPKSEEMYWRGPVLWDFDGRTWTQPLWMRNLPAEAVTTGDLKWDYQIELEPTDRRQLVALDLPTGTPASVQVSFDYGLYVAAPLSSLTRWRLQSAPPASFEPRLKQVLRQRALELPAGYNPRTLALAAQWRQEAGDSDDAVVRRALGWIRAEFAYTLETPLPGRHAVDEFLFDQKQGYCEHFSSAFVVLMRAAGVPARVVTGYAGGYRNAFGNYWVVRRMDAHAWAEVWLPQRGWVRVDGQIVSELGSKAYPNQKITLEKQAHQRQTQRATILLHKPVGYVSGQAEAGYRNAVSLIGAATQYKGGRGGQRFDPAHLRGLAPAGRLDIDSTGLLILTQDGRIARQIIGEDSVIDKEYLVRVTGKLSERGLELLNFGLSLDGKPLLPAQVSWQNDDQLRFILREGKKRQIRRMCELVGLKVVGLKRVRIGDLVLGDLPMGQWRYMKESESLA